MSGLTRFSTGFPVTLLNNNDTSLLGTQPNGINNNGVDEPEVAAGDLQVNHRPGTERVCVQHEFIFPAGAGDARQRAAEVLLWAGCRQHGPRGGEDNSAAQGNVGGAARGGVQCVQPRAIFWPGGGERKYFEHELWAGAELVEPAADAACGAVQVLSCGAIRLRAGVRGRWRRGGPALRGCRRRCR